MYEAAVVLAGAVLGLSAYGLHVKAGEAVVAAGAVTMGVVASAASGELAVSWVFVLVDVAQVAGGAVVGAFAAVGAERWRASA